MRKKRATQIMTPLPAGSMSSESTTVTPVKNELKAGETPPSTFIVFADARSGGTHLIAMLNSHPNILAVGEPFAHLNLRDHDEQVSWLTNDFATQNVHGKRIAVRGFRTKTEQIADPSRFRTYIEEHGVTCFHLVRRNVVKKAISRIRGRLLFEKTNDYNVRDPRNLLGPMVLRRDTLIKEIELCEAEEDTTTHYLNSLNERISRLCYEDMLLDETAFFDTLLSSLGVPRLEITSTTFKNTSDNLEESIVNFHDLKKWLKRTEYYEQVLEGSTV